MQDKPTSADGYSSEQVTLVRSVCLYIATKLGDLMDDLVVIGGLVPSLLIDQTTLPDGESPHVGTMDLDVGMALILLDEGRYTALTDRLRRAKFAPDENDQGNLTRQRWKLEQGGRITLDFLIPPSLDTDRGGTVRNIEYDFAAVITPGLDLAFRNRRRITLSGSTPFGEQATRNIWVCGPGAYIVLKALAFHNRGENKDAYDLYYIVRNFGSGLADVVAEFVPLLEESETSAAREILRRDFSDPESVGPRRVAEFLTREPNAEIQADVASFVTGFLCSVDNI